MKVLVIGCGSVGVAVAASLYNAGVQADLVARGETAESIKKNGLKRFGIFDTVQIAPERVHVFDSAAKTPGGYDFIVVSAKATANAAIANDLAAHPSSLLAPGGLFVIFQNGIGNERYFTGLFEQERIYTAGFAIGFRRTQRHVSEITVFSKQFQIGSLAGQPADAAAPLAASIEKGGIPCEISADIGKSVWAKLLYNCALNPLSALLNVNYGGLVVSESTKELMNSLIEEIYAVMQAMGHETFWPDAKAYEKEFYEKILPPTYSHPSSTLQDMRRKIPTEIDTLNGAVVRLGRQYNIATPCNEMLTRLIKSAEGLYHYGV